VNIPCVMDNAEESVAGAILLNVVGELDDQFR
jgi:hypothetical protein